MCTYPTRSTLGRPRAHVQDRIDHPEGLVLGLMHRQQQPATTPDGSGSHPGTALGAHSDLRDHVETHIDAGVDVDVDVQVEPEYPTSPSQFSSQPHEAHDQRQV